MRPIEAIPNALELPLTEMLDILRGEDTRMDFSLNRKVFAMYAKCIKSHRLENIKSLHCHPSTVYV